MIPPVCEAVVRNERRDFTVFEPPLIAVGSNLRGVAEALVLGCAHEDFSGADAEPLCGVLNDAHRDSCTLPVLSHRGFGDEGTRIS